MRLTRKLSERMSPKTAMKVTTQSTVNSESQTRKNLSPTKIAPFQSIATPLKP
jgi:hypothetical protein